MLAANPGLPAKLASTVDAPDGIRSLTEARPSPSSGVVAKTTPPTVHVSDPAVGTGARVAAIVTSVSVSARTAVGSNVIVVSASALTM